MGIEGKLHLVKSNTPTKNRWILFLFLIIGFLVFGRSVTNNFVWDDEELVVNNGQIHQISNWTNFIRATGFNSYNGTAASGIYFKPLQTLVYSVAWFLDPGNVFYFHVIQILLFVLNAFFIFLIFKHLLDPLCALILSLIFLVHPINSETAIYVADLQDTLYFFWGLLSLIVYLKLIKSSAPRILNILLGVLLLLALLSKESGILFFCALIVAQLTLGFNASKNKSFLLGSVFTAVFCYFLLRFSIAGLNLNFGHLSPISRASLFERLVSFPKVFSYYINNIFYPFNLEIGQHWVVSEINLEFLGNLMEFIFIFVLLTYFLVRKFSETALFFYLCFWGGILFHSQILFPLDLTVATRWFYFPFAFLLGFLGSLASSYKIRPLLSASFLIIGVLGIITFYRSLDWKDDLTLYQHDIVNNPASFDLNNNLGTALFRRGQVQEACTYFERSTQLAPHWWTNWNNLGVCYQRAQQYPSAEKHYLKAIQQGTYFLAIDNLINLYLLQNKKEEARKILSEYGLKYFPENDKIQAYQRTFRSAH